MEVSKETAGAAAGSGAAGWGVGGGLDGAAMAAVVDAGDWQSGAVDGAVEPVTVRLLAERLGRRRRSVEQAGLDAALLAWVDRFRFVTFGAVASYLGVSERRAAQRCRGLVKAGLLRPVSQSSGTRLVLYPTQTATRMLGSLPRRTPRPGGPLTHELAIIDAVLGLERGAREAGYQVLTERECRRRQSADESARYAVPLPQASGRTSYRWPDLVLQFTGRSSIAVEIELADKYSDRLRGILDGYLFSDYETVWLTGTATLAGRLDKLADERAMNQWDLGRERIRIHRWTDDHEQLRARVLPATKAPPSCA